MPAVIYGAEKDVYAVGTQQLRTIGQKMLTPDGSVFRYTEMGGTVGVAANLYQSSVPIGNLLSQDLTTAMTLGDTTITQTDGGASLVADQAAGGTILVEETADLGHIYRVKSNLVTASNEAVCTLEDGVTVQVTVPVVTNNATTLLLNPWKDVVIMAAPATAIAIGVPRVVIAVNGFGWVQTRGPASCLIDSAGTALVIGAMARVSETDDGSVALREETAGIVDWMDVGYCMETAPTADFGHIFLTLE